MAKRFLSQTELEAHLEEQIQFLETSAEAFDNGFEGEAKRLALTIRVLVHNTKTSHSLLSQLGRESDQFLDTAVELDPDNLMSHGGLVTVALGPPKTRFIAILDSGYRQVRRPFDEWWTAPIFVDLRKNVLSRKELILTAANQDGGGHVDPSLDGAYDAIAHENSLGISKGGQHGLEPMDGAESVAIRQVAHEVLKTLKPGYSKNCEQEAGAYAMGGRAIRMTVVPGVPNAAQAAAQAKRDRKNRKRAGDLTKRT